MTITEAAELTYSNNPIVIKAESDVLSTFDGSFFSVKYDFTLAETFGNGIEFDGVYFEAWSSPESISETRYLNGLSSFFIQTFNSNSQVNKRFFAFESATNEVTIKALFKGSRFNVTNEPNDDEEPAPTKLVEHLGTDSYFGDSQEDYGVYCELYVGEVNDFRAITTTETNNMIKVSDLLINYRKNNIYEFDLSGILRTYLNKLLPDLTLNIAQRIGNVIGYYATIGEVWKINDTYRQRQAGTNTNSKATILGAVDLTTINDATVHYEGGLALSLANDKVLYKDDGLYLFSFLKASSSVVGSLIMRCTYYYFDGTTTIATITVIPNSNLNGVYYFKFNASILNIDALELANGPIEFIGLKLITNLSAEYTQEITYRIESSPKQHKTLAFRNRYGVIDLYSFTGKYEEGINTTLNTFEKYYHLTPLKSDFKESVIRNESQKTYNYQSGWINENEFNNLQDLIKTVELYEVIDNEFCAIVPVQFGYNYNSDTDLYNVSVTAKRTIKENTL